MGFLGILPSKSDLIKRIVVEVIDGLNDQVDTEEEREEIAKWINEKVNIPILNEEEEQESLEKALQALSDALETIETLARGWK